MIPGLLPIFLHSCKIKSGSGLGMRLTWKCAHTTCHCPKLHTWIVNGSVVGPCWDSLWWEADKEDGCNSNQAEHCSFNSCCLCTHTIASLYFSTLYVLQPELTWKCAHTTCHCPKLHTWTVNGSVVGPCWETASGRRQARKRAGTVAMLNTVTSILVTRQSST